MQNEMHITQPIDDEIDLRELASVLWAGKKVILAVTSLFAVISRDRRTANPQSIPSHSSGFLSAAWWFLHAGRHGLTARWSRLHSRNQSPI